MKIASQIRRGPAEFNMTPMIDVVFLLIIFFLVSSHLARQEVHMQLLLPHAASGNLPDQEEQQLRLVVNVAADGQLQLAGRIVTIEQLQERLATRRQTSGDDLEVRIRSDRGVLYARINPLMHACAKAGIWNVTFAVYQPGEGN